MKTILYVNNLAYWQEGQTLTAVDGRQPSRQLAELDRAHEHVAHLRLVRLNGVLMYDDERLREYRTFGPPYQPLAYGEVAQLVATGGAVVDLPTGPLVKRLIDALAHEPVCTDEPSTETDYEPF